MIYTILEGLALNSSRNAKIDLLKSHEDNLLLKKVISLALDPYITFNIKKIPEYTSTDNQSLESVLNKLDELSSRRVTGNKAIDHLTDILSSVSSSDAKVIERIIEKDLKCGVSTATANKVYGKGFISKYPCMLASSYDDKNLKNITYPAIVQTKMDGMRANIFISSDGTSIVRSRSGRFIETFGMFDIKEYSGDSVVLDGGS